MSTINVNMQANMTVSEKYAAAELPGTQGHTVTYSDFNETKLLTATSTPAATMRYTDTLTGNQNLDFTALADPANGTIDASGLKLQTIQVKNKSETVAITLDDSVSNPYEINVGNTITIPPSGHVQLYAPEAWADVDATHKALDVTATGDFNITLIFG